LLTATPALQTTPDNKMIYLFLIFFSIRHKLMNGEEVSTPASAPSAVEWNRSVAAILLARHREFAQNGNANKSHTLLKVPSI
jgi:hypothetical protein